jgi:hypothetical protein
VQNQNVLNSEICVSVTVILLAQGTVELQIYSAVFYYEATEIMWFSLFLPVLLA